MDGKYGRIFTEADVKKLIEQATHNMAGWDRGMSEDQAKALLDQFEGKFPKDEPIFVLRGQDTSAAEAIEEYRYVAQANGASDDTYSQIKAAEQGFRDFANANPDRMGLVD